MLLLVPLTNLTVTSSALTGVRLPEFIMDFIWENGALTAVFVIVMAALYLHAFFLAFGIHFFTLCDESWMQARISSRSLLRGNAWRLARRLLALFAVFASGAVAAIVVGVLILAAILEGGLPFGVSFALTLVMFAFTIVVDCVFAPLSYAALSATFYEFSQERGIDVPYRIDEPSRTCRTRLSGRLLSRHARTRFVAVLRPFARGIRIRKPARARAGFRDHRASGRRARGSREHLGCIPERYRPRRGLGGA